MRAWLLDKLAGIQTLRLADAPDPVAAAGEVILHVHLAGLNPADRYLAEGQYPARPPFPHVLGRDGVGTVLSVGEGVAEWKPGDIALILRGEVGVSRWGTLAEKTAVPADSLARIPAGWTQQQAAGAPLVYMTAYQALTQFDEAPTTGPGNIVLVTGASGGVGVATVQLARAMGHTVIGLSRSAEKARTVEALGAEICLDPADTQWRRKLKAHLAQHHAGRRVDLAVDNVGGELFSDLLDTLGMNGRVSVVGRLAGPVPSFNTAALFFRRLRIGGVAVGTYTPAETRDVWGKVVALLADRRPVIDSTWPFSDVPKAFDALARGPMGKVLVNVAGG